MGFLSRILGRNEKPNSAIQPASGSHALTEVFTAPTDPTAITPMNGDRFIQHNFRSIPVAIKPRGFTAQEADAMEQMVEISKHRSRHGVRAFKSMAQNESADASLHEAHRQYLGAVAGSELRKVRANANLGKTLHQLRPAYARLGLQYKEAERSANNRVACLKARIAGHLN